MQVLYILPHAATGTSRHWHNRVLACHILHKVESEFSSEGQVIVHAKFWTIAISGLFSAYKFLCFKGKSDFIHFILVLMSTKQSMPTLIL